LPVPLHAVHGAVVSFPNIDILEILPDPLHCPHTEETAGVGVGAGDTDGGAGVRVVGVRVATARGVPFAGDGADGETDAGPCSCGCKGGGDDGCWCVAPS